MMTGPTLVLVALLTAAGQTPARDTAQSAAGTATISGVVMTDEPQGRPLRRVSVALQAADLRAPIAAVTDDEGRFVLKGVLTGHYTVMASRPGYVDTILGAKAGSILGAPIAVADGQDVRGLTIRMPRGSVITGVVRYASGRPAPDVQVQVSPVKTVDGRRRARFTPGLSVVSTDDRGVYRHFGLAPGDYLVQMMSGFGPGGPAEALRQTTSSEVVWAERVASAPAPPAPSQLNMPPPGRLVLPAPIYYQGTTDIAAARVITLGSGEERVGIDLVVDYMPTARLSGKVFDLDGRPRAGVTVRLNGKGGSSIAEMIGALVGQGGRTDEDGAFAIDAVPPGEYTLTSQAAPVTDTTKPAVQGQANLMTLVSGMFGRGGGAGSLYAAETVSVAGQDISNLELRLREGATVSGSVVFEGTAARPSTGAMQIMLSVATAQSGSPIELAMSMMQSPSAPVASDLTFSLKGVVPNRYRATFNLPGMLFGAALPNATWTLKSIRIGNGPDLADEPFDIDPGRDLSGVVVTLTDRQVVLSGKVLDADGRPSSAFPIIIFSTNPAHWSPGSRRVQQVRPASDGSYRLAGLPAGEYYVGAVTTLDLEDLYEPSFLQQIVPIAFRLTLADGETRQQDLKLGGRLRSYAGAEGHTMVVIRGGEFTMGSPATERGRSEDEIAHRVRIPRTFAVATTEVTNAQYARFLAAVPDYGARWKAATAARFDDPPRFEVYSRTPDSPQVAVSWYDGARYCNWLSERDGIPKNQWVYPETIDPERGMDLPPDYLRRTGYRLLTEAEWEFAARAGTATSRHFGDDETPLPRHAWYDGNTKKERAYPVAQLLPNQWGLFDMLGNVWEWTMDRRRPYPADGRLTDDVEDSVLRVSNDVARTRRGGSFVYESVTARSAHRGDVTYFPNQTRDNVGFRVGRTVD